MSRSLNWLLWRLGFSFPTYVEMPEMLEMPIYRKCYGGEKVIIIYLSRKIFSKPLKTMGRKMGILIKPISYLMFTCKNAHMDLNHEMAYLQYNRLFDLDTDLTDQTCIKCYGMPPTRRPWWGGGIHHESVVI